mgnify:CR=1 FL=1
MSCRLRPVSRSNLFYAVFCCFPWIQIWVGFWPEILNTIARKSLLLVMTCSCVCSYFPPHPFLTAPNP